MDAVVVQHQHPCYLPGMAHEINRLAERALNPVLALATTVIAAIKPDMTQVRKFMWDIVQQEHDPIPIHHVRRTKLS